MPTEMEHGTCPRCGSTATVVYLRTRGKNHRIVSEFVQRVECTNANCPNHEAPRS
jgi:hypothetical protein